MKSLFSPRSWLALVCLTTATARSPAPPPPKADGYRGIWYMNQPSQDGYVYKYSGGLGTY
jgi:hypothetical protein